MSWKWIVVHETISALKKCGNNRDNQLSNLQDYIMSLPRITPFQLWDCSKLNSAALAHLSLPVEVFSNVSTLNHLNLIGRSEIAPLDIDVRSLIQNQISAQPKKRSRLLEQRHMMQDYIRPVASCVSNSQIYSSLNWAV